MLTNNEIFDLNSNFKRLPVFYDITKGDQKYCLNDDVKLYFNCLNSEKYFKKEIKIEKDNYAESQSFDDIQNNLFHILSDI